MQQPSLRLAWHALQRKAQAPEPEPVESAEIVLILGEESELCTVRQIVEYGLDVEDVQVGLVLVE